MDKKTRANVNRSIQHIRSVLDDIETDLERHRNAGRGDGQHLSDAIANADTVADEAGNLGNMLAIVEAVELKG